MFAPANTDYFTLTIPRPNHGDPETACPAAATLLQCISIMAAITLTGCSLTGHLTRRERYP